MRRVRAPHPGLPAPRAPRTLTSALRDSAAAISPDLAPRDLAPCDLAPPVVQEIARQADPYRWKDPPHG